MKLSAAIVFVRDLARSRDFYEAVLGLQVEAFSAEAVVLIANTGDRVILRALAKAPRPSGSIGVQYLVWAAPEADELSRFEAALKEGDAFVGSRVEQGVSVVEGRDPDGITLIVCHPSTPPEMLRLPTRVYAY
jgi:catechol 2,3-dioxygenase-like lactoylglutathione lyase family enzyme